MQYVAPSSPLSIGGVLDNWIQLFRASFSRCWAPALIAVAGSAVMQFFITPPMPVPGQDLLQALQQIFAMMRIASLLMIVSWLITLIVNGALLTQQVAVMRGESPPSLSAALGAGVRRLPQMLLAVVLMALIVAAVCLPMGVGVGVIIALRHAGHDPAALTFIVVVVGLALAVFLIYLVVRLEFWLPALFMEDCGGAAALGYSWRLVKGHWWRVTMISFVAVIIMAILNMAFTWIAGILVSLAGIHAMNAFTNPVQFIHRMHIVGAIAAFGNVVIIPLLTAVALAIYHDLKLRREGGDLAARTEALSGT